MKQLENLDLNDVTIMSENEMKQVNGGGNAPVVSSFKCTCGSGNGGFMGAGTVLDLIELCEIYCGGSCNCD
jgi:natural product precursor